MSNVIGLTKSLRLRGGNKTLHKALRVCTKELFGLSDEEFDARWRPRVSDDTMTLRGYTQPTAEALFEEWKKTRDPSWLYSHEEYKWDSLGVSVFQTSSTTAGGINLLKKHDASPKLMFDWGAGPGFSTIMLARNFPDAEVHYNECNPDLIAIFEWFVDKAKIRNVKIVSAPEADYDCVQAYEIVEHIAHSRVKAVGDPVTETMKILEKMKKGTHFLHSSCWTAETNGWNTLGHFLFYAVNKKAVPNTKMNKTFRRLMADHGWNELGTGWNSRPFLFRKT